MPLKALRNWADTWIRYRLTEYHPKPAMYCTGEKRSKWMAEELTRINACPYKLFTGTFHGAKPLIIARKRSHRERDTRVALSDSLLQPDFSL